MGYGRGPQWTAWVQKEKGKRAIAIELGGRPGGRSYGFSWVGGWIKYFVISVEELT